MHPLLSRCLILLRGATQWTVLLPVVCLLLHLIPYVPSRVRATSRVVCRDLVATITFAYWLIIALRPELINLPGQVRLTPWEALVHSLPFLLTTLAVGRVKQARASLLTSFSLGVAVILAYLAYIHWAYHWHTSASWWPYPFMNHLRAWRVDLPLDQWPHTWAGLALGSIAGFGLIHVVFARLDSTPTIAAKKHK
jgi:hypothetical protein